MELRGSSSGARRARVLGCIFRVRPSCADGFPPFFFVGLDRLRQVARFSFEIFLWVQSFLLDLCLVSIGALNLPFSLTLFCVLAFLIDGARRPREKTHVFAAAIERGSCSSQRLCVPSIFCSLLRLRLVEKYITASGAYPILALHVTFQALWFRRIESWMSGVSEEGKQLCLGALLGGSGERHNGLDLRRHVAGEECHQE